MFYTFSFNDDFFYDLNNNVSREEFIKIENFIIHSFCEKENVFYSGSSKIIDRNKGKNGNNSDLLDNFLNNFEIREFGPFTDKPNNIIDFGFCGEKKKIDAFPLESKWKMTASPGINSAGRNSCEINLPCGPW